MKWLFLACYFIFSTVKHSRVPDAQSVCQHEKNHPMLFIIWLQLPRKLIRHYRYLVEVTKKIKYLKCQTNLQNFVRPRSIPDCRWMVGQSLPHPSFCVRIIRRQSIAQCIKYFVLQYHFTRFSLLRYALKIVSRFAISNVFLNRLYRNEVVSTYLQVQKQNPIMRNAWNFIFG